MNLLHFSGARTIWFCQGTARLIEAMAIISFDGLTDSGSDAYMNRRQFLQASAALAAGALIARAEPTTMPSTAPVESKTGSLLILKSGGMKV
jgi:hypothetical protein